jgi:hypothetical protein
MPTLHSILPKLALACVLIPMAGSAIAQAPPATPERPKMNDFVPAGYKGPVALITYFKAKPGMIDAYSQWMGTLAKAVDDWAAAHGAFESVVTYTNPDPSPNVAWTHMRVFTFKSRDQMKDMGAIMNQAHSAVYPDPVQREKAIGHKDYMRDSVGTATLTEVIQ